MAQQSGVQQKAEAEADQQNRVRVGELHGGETLFTTEWETKEGIRLSLQVVVVVLTGAKP